MIKEASFRILSLAVLVLTIVVYQNSFGVPFYLDDIGSITNNPNFQDASLSTLFSDYSLRVVGYVSLYVDFLRNKLDPTGYHYTNLLIHILNGVILYVLVKKLCSLEKLELSSFTSSFIAFLAASIFLLHPLQTQAVTYIVQRLASLVTLFYLLAICSYIYARSSKKALKQILFSLLCSIAMVLAFFTKQNAASLPLVILLVEYFFFNRTIAKKVVFSCIMVVVGIVCASFIFESALAPYVKILDGLTRETLDISRSEYFLSQLSILWIYVGTFFWPTELHLEYGKTIDSFGGISSVIAASAHIIAVLSAFYIRKKHVLIAFGIAFFYISHLVESSIIPIRDLIFEHRTYLPNVGLIFIVISLFAMTSERFLNSRKFFFPFVVAIGLLVVMSILTYQRNEEWLNPEQFYENELIYVPENVRVLHNYAEYSGRMGDLKKSEELINRMYEAADGKLDGVMVNTHVVLLMSQGKFRDAVNLAERLLKQPNLNSRARVHVLSNIGIVYTVLGKYKRADGYFREAFTLGGMTTKSLTAYAFSLYKNGVPLKALEVIEEVKRLNPNDTKASELEKKILGLEKREIDIENE